MYLAVSKGEVMMDKTDKWGATKLGKAMWLMKKSDWTIFGGDEKCFCNPMFRTRNSAGILYYHFMIKSGDEKFVVGATW